MRFFPCLALLACLTAPLGAEPRSFDGIFPGLPADVRAEVFSPEGHISTFENPTGSRGEIMGIRSALDSRPVDAVLAMRPTVLVESLLVVPGDFSLLDVYNAISRIRDLQGRLYRSHRRQAYVPLFEEATRIDGRRNPIADPPPATAVPRSETIHVRLRDANFGNTFYRADMRLDDRGLRYSLTNNRTITYLLFPAIREGRFVAQMYFEPIAEGILIHSIAGVDVSNFVASQIHMPSAISRRLAVIVAWAADGIRG